ncbi:hypothetical protein [Streptomyces griseoluteus]|uniref:hypothetical protein n=1 Tax=Streptomyces griseoluteus TaxID=29306 RepID=UPI0036502927
MERLDDPTYDQQWAGDRKDAFQYSAILLAYLLILDWGTGGLTLPRGALWFALALLLLLVLHPARVSAGDSWLASRRLLRERRVRTDRLVSVRCLDGVSQRILLRDAFGDRVEIDPDVLVRNPGLWYRLEAAASRSASAGLLLCGQTALERLSARVEREAVQGVFKASGMK